MIHLRQKIDELSDERLDEIQNLSRIINFNNLTCYFQSKSSSPINFISLKGPLKIYRNILNSDATIKKKKKNKNKQSKLDLNEIKRGNPKKNSKDQLNTTENIKDLYESR